ncbi:MAG TPA: DNA-processing protein DprA [Steroidobacteraceae bacterium]|nr:DNA-processing protein DprA [Steroidobacteraceae bacterium]
MDVLAARAVLARAPGLDAAHVSALHAAAGGMEESLIDPATWTQVDLPPQARAYLALPDERALRADLRWLGTSGARLLLSTDAEYPSRLLQTPGAPGALFVHGNAAALAEPQIAIVGSRTPTAGGVHTAKEFAACLARAGLTVTSGLALGIDAASHEGALRAGGSTIAVCGTGLDRMYPTQHEALAARIRSRGALVSEFPPGTPPRAPNFPRRNRLISALALGVLVVEAAQRSGSLSTARWAADQGREVFAVPGSIHNPRSRGCHKLIRDGALLVESAAEVLAALGFPEPKEALVQRKAGAGTAPALDKEYEMLLDAVGFEPVTVDVLAARTGLPGDSIASMLLILELEGRIASQPGGRFGRVP